jgi:acetate---CoA ligase (ADP-forming)
VSAASQNVRRLLRPQSVAFVGGSLAPAAMAVCESLGFCGPIYAVHPTRPLVDGRPAYPSVDALPEIPDAVFVAVNAAASVEIVRQLSDLGAGGAVLYAAGFSEAGTAAGAALEQELREVAGELAVLGPNCYGLVDLVGGVSLWPVPLPQVRRERGVAMILQSGNLGINVTMSQRSLPLAFVASVGNQAALEIAELVDAYLDMEEVTGIGIYLEGLRDVPRFAAAATRALERGVPIAVCKAGRSELGRELAYTHTASLAGSDGLYRALFERYGVAACDSLPELLETLKALVTVGRVGGRRVFVFTCSGAEAALSADAAAASGLDLPQPPPETRDSLIDALPEHALVSNPLDYGNALWGQEEPLRRVFSTALSDPVDAALLVIDYPLPGFAYETDVDAAIRALGDAAGVAGIPAAVTSVLPESVPEAAREAMLTHGICPLQGLDDAFAALAACARLGERPRPVPYPAVVEPPADAVPLGERAAKELLEPYGVVVPDGRLVPADEAAAAAQALGFPVAVKLASPDLAHKAASGALALDLRDGGEVAEAVEAMLARNPAARSDGVLVERMIEGGVCELLVGARHDPAFGHVLYVGSGGSLVELVADARPVLPPVERADVEAALGLLRVWPRLQNADVQAAVDATLAVARLVEERGSDIVELEVNPLLVLERGAVAVDALCVSGPTLSGAGAPPPARPGPRRAR